MVGIDSGNTAWIMIATAMVMLMTPGLALFYGGMVRRQNLLSTLMMSFAMLAVVGVLWAAYGYSLSFGTSQGGFIGGLNYIFLKDVGQAASDTYATTVPHLSFMSFQAMFAVIAIALVTGAVVERVKFGTMLVFAVLWITLVYGPVAHWVWGSGGWLAKLGAMDFAGGAVIHINAGVSALALALILGKRDGFPKAPIEPNSIPLVLIGASLLWFGWFGFNAGSSLAADGLASTAFVATNISAAAAGLTWMLLSWLHKRPSVIGTLTGAVVGLVAITPAAGFVAPIMGIPIGAVGAVVCYYGLVWLKSRSRIDDSLDVFAVHGIGGIWGALATGIFSSTAVNSGGSDGLIYGNAMPLVWQLVSVLAICAYAFVVSWILGKVLDLTMGFRVDQKEEMIGLDISQHGERAYGGMFR